MKKANLERQILTLTALLQELIEAVDEKDAQIVVLQAQLDYVTGQ